MSDEDYTLTRRDVLTTGGVVIGQSAFGDADECSLIDDLLGRCEAESDGDDGGLLGGGGLLSDGELLLPLIARADHPADADIGGGNVAVYAKGATLYQKAHGADPAVIGAGADGNGALSIDRTAGGSDIYQLPQAADSLDLQGEGEIKRANSVQTDDVSASAPIDNNNQSASALVGEGYHVATSWGGKAMAWRDPRNFATDDAAIQELVTWVENNTDLGGMVHVPNRGPDGNVTTIENQVALSADDNTPVGFHLWSHGSFQGPGFDAQQIQVTINNGNKAFVQRGHVSNTQKIRAPFIAGGVEHNSGDTGLLRQRAANGLIWIYGGVVQGFSSQAAITIQGRSNEGYIWAPGRISPDDNTATGILFEQAANGETGSHWGLSAWIGDTAKDCLRIEDGWLDVVVEGGHYEGADDTNATTAANIHVGSSSDVYVTSSVTLGNTATGAHGVFVDGSGVIQPSVIRNAAGDGIRIGSNASYYKIGQATQFFNTSGDDINDQSSLSGAEIGILPYENTLNGSVTYPSEPWSRHWYPDGWQLLRTGTATVSAGTTATVQGFAGRSTTETKAHVYLISDPSNNNVAWNWWWQHNNGDSQRKLVVEEKLGSEDIDIGYVITRRGISTNLSHVPFTA